MPSAAVSNVSNTTLWSVPEHPVGRETLHSINGVEGASYRFSYPPLEVGWLTSALDECGHALDVGSRASATDSGSGLAHEQRDDQTVLIVLRPDVRAAPVNRDDRLVPDDPSIVTGLEHAHLSWTDLELGAVSHTHTNPSRDRVLEVRRLAQFGAGDRLHVFAPPPTRLQGHPHDLASTDLDDLRSTERHLPNLTRCIEAQMLCVRHRNPLKLEAVIEGTVESDCQGTTMTFAGPVST